MKNIILRKTLRQHALLGCLIRLYAYRQVHNKLLFRVPKAGGASQPADGLQILP